MRSILASLLDRP